MELKIDGTYFHYADYRHARKVKHKLSDILLLTI